MDYRFKMDVRPVDYWVLTMTSIYKSFIGVINVVFTLAMAALAVRFLGRVNSLYGGIIVFGLCIFPVIHPLLIWGQSIKQTEHLPKGIELEFNDKRMRVFDGAKSENIPYSRIRRVQKRNNMIIIMTTESHGYMLTNNVLGDKKDRFYDDLVAKIKG